MPVYLSNDQLDRVVETFEKQQLTDTPANVAWQEAIRYLATRWLKTPTYRIVFALCRELSRLDYRLANRGLNPGERRYSGRYVLTHEPTLHDVEELLSHLATAPIHLKTASALAQAAFAYYREHGQTLSVPHGVMPAAGVTHQICLTCGRALGPGHACIASASERANLQRVVE